MTSTTDNPTPSPSTLAGFLAGGYHEDCPTASMARYAALNETSRQQRFNQAFAVLLDDHVTLDDGLGPAGPADVAPGSWVHTVMGRRALEMLMRLERSYVRLVTDGALEAAWAVIEACAGFVAVAVWLHEVHLPAECDDGMDLIEGLVDRVGAVPYLLVAEFAQSLPPHEVLACASQAEAMLIDRDDVGLVSVELDRLRTYRAVWDVDVLAEAIESAAESVRVDLEFAIDRSDFRTLEHIMRLGVGLVYLRLRLEDDGEAEVA